MFRVLATGGLLVAWNAVAETPHEIVFDSQQHGAEEIYVANPDGSDIRRITDTPAPYFSGYPRWSPDHANIAFISNRDGDEELYLMDAEGRNVIRLIHNPGDDWSPAWSPDGSKIAFVSGPTNHGDIFIMNSDGAELKLLGDWVGEASGDLDWSSDGSQLLFVSRRVEDREQIYLLNMEAQTVRPLTGLSDMAESSNPSWSPSGRYIVFTSNRRGRWDVYRMEADGLIVHRLTISETGEIGSWAAAQSPDGENIVFSSDRIGANPEWRKNAEIFIIDSDGSNLRRITENDWMDAHPDW